MWRIGMEVHIHYVLEKKAIELYVKPLKEGQNHGFVKMYILRAL